MRHLIVILALAVSCLAATSASAEVFNPNPNATISIVGNDTALLSTRSQVLDEGFAVRLVNPLGQPMPGLKVEFFVDVTLPVFPPPPGAPPPPPAETYGRFATPSGWVVATTDANGVARSGPFVAGTVAGSYKVAATLPVTFYPENAVLVSPPGPSASFDVKQLFDYEGIPVDSPVALIALMVLILFVASRHARRFLN